MQMLLLFILNSVQEENVNKPGGLPRFAEDEFP